MDLYRIVVLRKGFPVWDGVSPVGTVLGAPFALRATPEQLAEIRKESENFIGSLPSLGRVTHHVPSDEELAKGFSLRTDYVVRTVWEKDQLLVWFNQIFASKQKAINPAIAIVAKAYNI
jgi:hypothetical protein